MIQIQNFDINTNTSHSILSKDLKTESEEGENLEKSGFKCMFCPEIKDSVQSMKEHLENRHPKNIDNLENNSKIEDSEQSVNKEKNDQNLTQLVKRIFIDWKKVNQNSLPCPVCKYEISKFNYIKHVRSCCKNVTNYYKPIDINKGFECLHCNFKTVSVKSNSQTIKDDHSKNIISHVNSHHLVKEEDINQLQVAYR